MSLHLIPIWGEVTLEPYELFMSNPFIYICNAIPAPTRSGVSHLQLAHLDRIHPTKPIRETFLLRPPKCISFPPSQHAQHLTLATCSTTPNQYRNPSHHPRQRASYAQTASNIASPTSQLTQPTNTGQPPWARTSVHASDNAVIAVHASCTYIHVCMHADSVLAKIVAANVMCSGCVYWIGCYTTFRTGSFVCCVTMAGFDFAEANEWGWGGRGV